MAVMAVSKVKCSIMVQFQIYKIKLHTKNHVAVQPDARILVTGIPDPVDSFEVF